MNNLWYDEQNKTTTVLAILKTKDIRTYMKNQSQYEGDVQDKTRDEKYHMMPH